MREVNPVFPMVEMSRLTVAGPLDAMQDVLDACDALACVHVQPYEQFEEGIGVGQSVAAEGTGGLLTKVRAVRAATAAVNSDGPMPRKHAMALLEGAFPGKIDDVLALMAEVDEAKARLESVADERHAMQLLAPLGLLWNSLAASLDWMSSSPKQAAPRRFQRCSGLWQASARSS